MKPTPELIYEYRMSRERAEREARERREAACTAIPRLREIADQRRRLAFDTGLMIMRGTRLSFAIKLSSWTKKS